MRRTLLALAACAGLGALAAGCAAPTYTVNGALTDPNTSMQLAAMGLPPGHYWLAQNGDWGAVGSARPWGNLYAQQAQAGGYSYTSGGVYGGSGSVYGNGSWSHYSSLAGGVGGDGNGCVYAGSWSNC